MAELEQPTDHAAASRALRRRSIAIAVLLAVMVLMFYAATIVRLGGNVANKVM
ncbi:MAG: protein CoxF [Hyphomicrobium sp.]